MLYDIAVLCYNTIMEERGMEREIILASSSPRRRELLSKMGVPYACISPDVDESFSGPPREAVVEIARRKARAVAQSAPEALVIGADTLVCVDGMALGKPRDREDAARMLRLLSGREHDVFTGVCVICGKKEMTRLERSGVVFRPLEEEEIAAYTATDEPYDKAGGYAIQGAAAAFIARYHGSYENIMGFPVDVVAGMLAQFQQ